MLAPALDVLTCTVARAHIGLPRAAVDQLIEYELAPLPAPAPYVGGLGVYAGRIVVSVALTPALGQRPRTTRGVLVAAPGSTRWCVEVSTVAGFAAAELVVDGDGAGGAGAGPGWLRRARLAGGRSIIAVDVLAMVASLTAGVGHGG